MGNKMSVNIDHYILVNKGDFVINSMNFGIGGFGVSPYDGITSPAYIVLRPNVGDNLTKYLERIFQDEGFQKGTAILGDGILELRRAIGWKHLKRQPIPIPPYEERVGISRLLDSGNDALDKLIPALQKMVSLLEEKRSALITQAVSKGLNPDATMKNSGIHWIGKIPAHWEVKKLKHVSDCLDGVRIPLNAIQRSQNQGDIPYYGATKQVDTVANWLFDETLVLLGEDAAPFFDHLKDVAYRIDGKSWVNNHAHVLRPNNIEATYLTHSLNIVNYSDFIDGSTRDKLNQSKMKEIPVPCPPHEECERIGARIREFDSKNAGVIKSVQSLIETLVEYRMSLISAAVTGKIDLREWQGTGDHA